MKMLVGGRERDARDGKTIEVLCPYDGTFLDTVPSATREDVEEAVHCAREGFKQWSIRPLHERIAILRRYIELVDEHKEKIAEIMSLEQGRPYAQNLAAIKNNVDYVMPGYLDAVRHFYGKTTVPGAYPGKEKDFQIIVREPLGVMVSIIPFNSPINLFLKKAIPALVTGNALIVKPASDAPLAMLMLVKLFVDAGVTPLAISIITGSGSSVGGWLAENPGVNAISFTGSTEVGKEIVGRSSVNLTRCFMELGGNDACIILDDADIELAVQAAVAGRCMNAGQICASPKRYLVQKGVVETFTECLVSRLDKIVIGHPMDPKADICCLINERAAANAEAQIRHTLEQGARLVCGGGRKGTIMEPVVLADVTKEMDVARNMEIFAPVFPILKVESSEEAIEIANNSDFGLSGSVFSNDVRKAWRIAQKMETGQVVINGNGFYMNPDAPFGGYKSSGLGREGISVTLSEFTQEKTLTFMDIL